MSKTTAIILCVVYSALLWGMGWLFMKASELEPKTSEDAKLVTAIPARPVKAIIYHHEVRDNVDKTIICSGGGDEDYKPRGPTMLAGEPAHRC